MRVRHILLTSAASVSLFLIAASMPEAHAQKGTFLSPASPWAVTKVAGNAAAGQAGYCAVAKRFEENAILTIARNQGTETSLALDLQKPLFNTSHPMNVTLDPGAGEQRDYSVSPASAQAFVVRLGRDEAFFNAIDRTGILRVEVADKSYVFNVSDIDSGQNKLNSCLAASVQPAAGSEAPVSFRMEVESKSNKEFIDQLNARIQSLEAKNTALQAKIVDVEKEDIMPARAAPKAADQSEAMRVETLRAENLRLKAALQAGELELRNDKLSMLEADNARLSRQVSRQSNASEQVTKLQKQIDELLVENSRLINEQNNSSDAELSALEDNIRTLEAENQSLKVALTKQSENDVSDQLRARIEQIESENRALKDKAASDRLAAYQADNVEINKIRAQHAQEVESLRAQIEGLRLAQNTAAADDQEIEKLSLQVSKLRADNLLLQQELHEKSMMVSQASLADDSADIAALEFENAKLQSKIDKSVETHALQDKAIIALEAENAALKNELNGINVAANDVDALNEKLEMLSEKLRDSEENFAEHQEKMAALKEENASLKVALDERVQENLSLVSALEDMSALRDEISAKDAKLAEFDGVPERLQSLLESYEKAKAEKTALQKENEAIIAAQDGREDIAAQLAEAQARNETFVQKLKGLEQSVLAMSKLNEEVKALTLALSEKENQLKELDELRGELSQVVAENAALKEEKSELSEAFEMASNDNTLEDENAELRRALSSVMEKVEGQNKIIQEREKSISNVMAKNEVLKGQLDLAAQLMAANDVAAAEAPLKTAEVEEPVTVTKAVAKGPEAKVILASASAPTVEKRKPSVVRTKPSDEDVSFAQTLAQIEPAAGEEDMVEENNGDVVSESEVVQDAQDFMDRDLNQAQIYEEQLKRSLKNQETVQQSPAEPIEVETLEEEIVAQEPMIEQDIDAVVEKASAPQELPELEEETEIFDDAEEVVLEESSPIESETVNAVEDAQNFVSQKEALQSEAEDELVSVQMSQDPFEGIAVEGEDEVGASDDVATVSMPQSDFEDSMPLPKAVKQPQSTAIEMEDIAAQDGVEPSAAPYAADSNNAIEQVLRMSNVAGISAVSAVGSTEGAYQWRAGELFGSGEQREMNSLAQFDGFVKEYLTKTEARCPGDFAIVPDNTKESGSIRVDSYEIACVGDGVSSSASLIFYNQGGMFNVLAHETEAAKMSEAMAVRDKIFDSLISGRDS